MLKGGVARVVFGFALFMPVCSYGALVVGSTLNIGGNFNVGAVFLNWNCNQPGDPVCASPPAGHGDFNVLTSTGTFAQYNGTFGQIADISQAGQPIGETFPPLPNFITFDLNGGTSDTITLTFIPIGTDPQSPTCAGLTNCTPTNAAFASPGNPAGASAFNLDQNANGTAAVFAVNGTITEGGQTGTITGIFSSELDGVNPQQALAMVPVSPPGLPVSYSGQLTINSVVPEPITLGLTGAGLLGLGLFRRWRRG